MAMTSVVKETPVPKSETPVKAAKQVPVAASEVPAIKGAAINETKAPVPATS
jgi:hypothetical protein